MTWGLPQGYRVPADMSLSLMSWALESHAWPTWRDEAVRTLALVADELARSPQDHEQVLRRLSNGQVGEDDLVLSRAKHGCARLRAGEFLDVAHAVTQLPSGVPLPPTIDLRCTARFMVDPADDSRWAYVLLATERSSMEAMFLALPDVEAYPVPTTAEYDSGDPEVLERAEIWARVTLRYSTFSPPSIHAPELTLALDLLESILAGQDPEPGGSGKITASELEQAVRARYGAEVPDDLHERLSALRD